VGLGKRKFTKKENKPMRKVKLTAEVTTTSYCEKCDEIRTDMETDVQMIWQDPQLQSIDGYGSKEIIPEELIGMVIDDMEFTNEGVILTLREEKNRWGN